MHKGLRCVILDVKVTIKRKLSDFLVSWRILIMHEQHQIAVWDPLLSMFKCQKDGTNCSL